LLNAALLQEIVTSFCFAANIEMTDEDYFSERDKSDGRLRIVEHRIQP